MENGTQTLLGSLNFEILEAFMRSQKICCCSMFNSLLRLIMRLMMSPEGNSEFCFPKTLKNPGELVGFNPGYTTCFPPEPEPCSLNFIQGPF